MIRLLFIFALVAGGVPARAAVETSLAKDGQARQVIVTGTRVLPAARTLAEYLEKISGASFTITNGTGVTGIAVGTVRDFPELKLAGEFESEQYILRSHSNGVYVIGATELAVQHAVWDLLHRLGYRQFFPGAHWEVLPAKKDLRIAVAANEKPDWQYRRIWYGFGPWEVSKKPYAQWLERNRMGGGFNLSSGHAYEGIIKAKKAAFELHPEYLALVGGERKGSKFCIANPGLRQLVVEASLDRVKPDTDSLSLEPSDGGGWCECDDCKQMGSVTDRVVTLANEVAAALDKKYPNKYVCIYAYSFHAPPPKVKPHPRLIVSVATSYRPAGYTTERLLDEWSAAGTQRFGIREYYSVFWWDRSLPGGGYAANLTYITNSLATFHAKGARYLSAESSDAWGSHGLGYYVASRLLWRTDVTTVGAIVEDFLDKAFGDAREPMRKFYELIDGANKPRLSDHLIGTMYRLLQEAAGKTQDAGVRARLDDLVLYTRYVDLYQQFIVRKKDSPERQQAWEELLRFAYRARATGMVDVQVLYRNFWFRYGGGVKVPEEAGFKVPEPKNPWKSSEPFTRAEIDALLTAGVGKRPVTEITTAEYSHELVPVTPLQPPRLEFVTAVGRSRRVQNFYTWFDKAPATLELTGSSGLLNHKERPRDAEVKLFSLGESDRVVQDRAPIPSDKEKHPLTLKTTKTGLHLVEVTAPGTGAQLDWKPGTVMTMEMSNDYQPGVLGALTLWFYVPRGATEVAGFSPAQPAGKTPARLRDGGGVERFRFANEAGYFKAAVPVGQDGQFWRVEAFTGNLILLTVPPFVARHPQELLLPKEVVEADAPEPVVERQ